MLRERKRKRKRKRKKKRLVQRRKDEQLAITTQPRSEYHGTEPSKPIYGAVKGCGFEVTTGKVFYGLGGPYAMFAGNDASRALAKMSNNDEDISPSLDGLTETEIGVLNDWATNKVHRNSKSFVFPVKVATFCSSVMEDQLNKQLPCQYMQRSEHALEIPEAEVEEELLKRKQQKREEWFGVDGKLLFVTYSTLLGESTYIVDGEGKLRPHPLKEV